MALISGTLTTALLATFTLSRLEPVLTVRCRYCAAAGCTHTASLLSIVRVSAGQLRLSVSWVQLITSTQAVESGPSIVTTHLLHCSTHNRKQKPRAFRATQQHTTHSTQTPTNNNFRASLDRELRLTAAHEMHQPIERQRVQHFGARRLRLNQLVVGGAALKQSAEM